MVFFFFPTEDNTVCFVNNSLSVGFKNPDVTGVNVRFDKNVTLSKWQAHVSWNPVEGNCLFIRRRHIYSGTFINNYAPGPWANCSPSKQGLSVED